MKLKEIEKIIRETTAHDVNNIIDANRERGSFIVHKLMPKGANWTYLVNCVYSSINGGRYYYFVTTIGASRQGIYYADGVTDYDWRKGFEKIKGVTV